MLRPLSLMFISFLAYGLASAQDAGQKDQANKAAEIVLEQKADRVTVTIDGDLFTEYIFAGYEKPILYPVIGPYGIRMTRDYPMRQDNPDEKQDHPHHKSIWFGHMEVGGESFWHSGESAGTTVQDSIRIEGNSILCTNRLIGKQGGLIATDSRKISFAAQGPLRFIDYEVTYHASEGRVQFGDNKDGQMGIRMNPRLRISGPVATGKAINAEGVREQEIWGKRSPWIDYWGEVDGHTVGIAMFDHPTNFRHPTWWHAREYGLLSANPFGIHHFEESNDAHLGDHLLLKGESLTFKHRFVFHPGDYEQAQIAVLYEQWAKTE
ncbi:MAG: PmoA family protein [bacterium]|nr:PmoA family protein [bacterium]